MWAMRRSLISALLCALALVATAAMPVTGFAQSIGDDQYSDPIPNGGDGGNGGGGGNSGGGGNTGGGGGGTTTPPATPSGTTPGTTTPGAATTPSSGGAEGQKRGELPRTGFDVLLTIELGMAMLLLGVVGQRLLVLRERRDLR